MANQDHVDPAAESSTPRPVADEAVRELAGDSRRQAVASVAGTIYQAWASIDAWLSLTSPDESIYLEGAEDFDTVRSAGAVAVQVKNRSAGISLGLADARLALERFWLLSRAEHPRRVDLHYLTTSVAVKEQDAVFNGLMGIDAWRVAADDTEYARLVSAYLEGKLGRESALGAFLRVAEIEDVQERLFKRFHWITDQPLLSDLKTRVHDRIVARLYEVGKVATYAQAVGERLESRFWEVVTHTNSSERRLTLGALLTALDSVTNVLVPVDRLLARSELGLLINANDQRAWGSTADRGIAKLDAETGSEALRSWPKAIEGWQLERPELETLLERIRSEPAGQTLVIGEAGAGKSALLAELTARLEAVHMIVFAIKADVVPPDVATIGDVSRSLGFEGDIRDEVELLARDGPVVLLIDQLDAVSEVMDRTSQRMRLLLQLANRFRATPGYGRAEIPVHVVVSSRQFEAEHDARFQSLQAEVVSLALPTYAKVEELLAGLQIDPSIVPPAMREPLRRPFALRLFVEIVRRRVPVGDLIAAELLNTWLTSVNLGDPSNRREVLSFVGSPGTELEFAL